MSTAHTEYAHSPAYEERQYGDTNYIARSSHSLLIGYLAWIFGFIGAHRFYYGKRKTGALWFCTLGLLGIGWIIDLFLIPRMDREADMRFADGPLDYNVAWLLWFIPFSGIHRLYMGKLVTGLIWLFTGGLFGVGWLYDLWTLNQQVDEINRRAY